MNDDIKKGLLGIVVDETVVSQVMPDINSLTYRGYAVQELCEKCIFEEVAYLVLNGELPNKAQLNARPDYKSLLGRKTLEGYTKLRRKLRIKDVSDSYESAGL